MKKFLFTFAIIFFTFTTPMFAWWDLSHYTIAQIAYDELDNEKKITFDNYIKEAAKDFPEYNDFVSSAVWADDIVKEGINCFFNWHGYSLPYDPSSVLSKQEYEKIAFTMNTNNSVVGIKQCLKTLNYDTSSNWAKGFMLRMLIHIIGDVHQPLHCITYYGKDFPQGDRAGTKFIIKQDGKYLSLHSFLDSICLIEGEQFKKPLSEKDRNTIKELSSLIKMKYPKEILNEELKEKNMNKWAKESYNFGVSIYEEALKKENKDVEFDDEFISQTQDECFKRIALAGYRLANILNKQIPDSK